MKFHDITVVADGSHYSERTQDIDRLEPKAVDVFARMLAEAKGAAFRRPIPVEQFAYVSLDWQPTGRKCGIATFGAHDTLATCCALACGIDDDGDLAALKNLRDTLAKMLGKDYELRPGFDLLHVSHRPVIVAVPWMWLPQIDRENVIPDMETCFAAAMFGHGA